jgi:radical SAM superfamily enzyme YgiQ (UPF0313 family)
MSVLLSTLNAKYIHLNLAIRLLYHLYKDKHNLNLKEFTIKENKDAIAEFCKNFEVVAFSCYIWNITQTLQVCELIKKINPNCLILLGGPEVSYENNDVINLPYVDFIIEGEGETAFNEFLNCNGNYAQVSNLVYKENHQIKRNKAAANFNLNNYKYINPYIEDGSDELNNKVCYIETSRGCPYKCEFCLASLDNKVRYLPIETIKEHLLYLMNNGRVIKFLDRTFNIKKDFTLDIFEFILKHHRPENVFQFEITADILHPDIIRFINEKVPKNLFRFEIGIQTVNQSANLEVSRKQNFEKTKNIILQVQEKVELHLDLIVGLPLDYWNDIKYSFEEVFKLKAPELQLGFLKFLKGTTMRDKAQHEFVFDQNPPYQLIKSKYLNEEELADIVKLEHALEIYWNGKKTINTLSYVISKYSSFDFLLGLGKFFGEKKDFHKYSLEDVYLIASEFCKLNYPNDTALQELLAIDYYLHHKVKPKPLLINEIDKKEKFMLLDELKLNHHKYRFIVLPILNSGGEAISKFALNKHIIIQYSGKEKAKIIKQNIITPVY